MARFLIWYFLLGRKETLITKYSIQYTAGNWSLILSHLCTPQRDRRLQSRTQYRKPINSSEIALSVFRIRTWADMAFEKIWTSECALRQIEPYALDQTVVPLAKEDTRLNPTRGGIFFIVSWVHKPVEHCLKKSEHLLKQGYPLKIMFEETMNKNLLIL